MKAVVLTRFGTPDVLQLREVPKPTPKDHEVLIRIHATTASAGDCELRGLKFPPAFRLFIRIYFGLRRRKPLILGQEIAGDVEAVGPGVTRFRAGDAVIGWTGFSLGGYAEYTCMPETGALATKPSTMTYEEAVPIPVGGLEAVWFIPKAELRPGDELLIVGAGGSIGTFAVQLAKQLGVRVTAVDRSEKLDMLRSIGADQVIDYTREDYTKGGATYDAVFDVVGKVPASRTMRLLRPHGRCLMGNTSFVQKFRARRASKTNGAKVIFWAAKTPAETADGFRSLQTAIEAGKVVSVIDRRYPLERTAEAHRYVDTGQKKGSVVITVRDGDRAS